MTLRRGWGCMPAIGAAVKDRLAETAAAFAMRATAALAMLVEPPGPRNRGVSGVLTPVLEAEYGGTRFAEESRRRDGS